MCVSVCVCVLVLVRVSTYVLNPGIIFFLTSRVFYYELFLLIYMLAMRGIEIPIEDGQIADLPLYNEDAGDHSLFFLASILKKTIVTVDAGYCTDSQKTRNRQNPQIFTHTHFPPIFEDNQPLDDSKIYLYYRYGIRGHYRPILNFEQVRENDTEIYDINFPELGL